MDRDFLADQLKETRSYRRITGDFTSSLFQVAGELSWQTPDMRIVCDVDLAAKDLPDGAYGFVHGKAGVIERADERKVGFIGSMNETRNSWHEH